MIFILKVNSKREILVGVSCVECGTFVPTKSIVKELCNDCFKEKRRKYSREKYRKNKKIYSPKYCVDCNKLLDKSKWKRHNVKRCEECQIKYVSDYTKAYSKTHYRYRGTPKREEYPPKYCKDCGELIEKNKWNKPNATRCNICQYKFNKSHPSSSHYGRKDLQVIVAVTCKICNKLITTNSSRRKICEECLSYKRTRVPASYEKKTPDEKYKLGKKYIKKINPKLYYDKKMERLGTFDTSPERGDVSKIKRDKSGNPDWEKERKAVDRLLNKTFNKKKGYGYSMTEGDVKRNIVKEVVDK